MAAKKTEQGQDSTSEKAAGAAQGDVNQSTAGAPATAAPAQTGPAATGEQPSDPAVPAAPAIPSPSAPAADAAALGDVTGTPELAGYLVTDVSSVLHNDAWYHEGDEIFLSNKEANQLLHRRIIEPSRSEK
ncbi:hypothetical protein [Pseudomonas sp. NPDC096950]|uniref:hypothetical protein n=1 Tax=Pseudomonas sp. NPDC096950 TaxID=3364485 RepID=UPI00383A67AF